MAAQDSSSLEMLFDDLSFPTSLAIGKDGTFYVAESGLSFDGPSPGGRVWHLEPSARRTLLVESLRAPVWSCLNGDTLIIGDEVTYIRTLERVK